jgi:hypothetical protein
MIFQHDIKCDYDTEKQEAIVRVLPVHTDHIGRIVRSLMEITDRILHLDIDIEPDMYDFTKDAYYEIHN